MSTIIINNKEFARDHAFLDFRWALTVIISQCNQVVINIMETCDSKSFVPVNPTFIL